MAEELARQHHAQWLANFDGPWPRIKEIDGASFDICVAWHELHPAWRRQQVAAQQDYVDAVAGVADMETAASIVHDVWMLNNIHELAARPHLFRPYEQLQEAEKNKDRATVQNIRDAVSRQVRV